MVEAGLVSEPAAAAKSPSPAIASKSHLEIPVAESAAGSNLDEVRANVFGKSSRFSLNLKDDAAAATTGLPKQTRQSENLVDHQALPEKRQKTGIDPRDSKLMTRRGPVME